MKDKATFTTAENEKAAFIGHYLLETWGELTDYLLQHPEKLALSQLNYWQSYVNLCQEYSSNQPFAVNSELPTDKRFLHADWQKNLIFNFIQRSYQLLSQQSDHFSKQLLQENEKIAKKFHFYSQQFIDSISPSNFINTNPEILLKTFESNGANLVAGFKQFKEDLERGKGQLQISLTDPDQFTLGKNIACTPGKIIYQNQLMQLIHYTPTTDKVYQNPLLIIPPWINKYYILDLQPENSFVKWLLDQGQQVFMISWVNPTRAHQEKQFFNYLHEGPLTALTIINEITQGSPVNVIGYCIGGTLLACLLAYCAQINRELNILSATFLTTLLDFSEPGELGAFIDEKQISMLEENMREKGYLEGNIMASVFNALRANDLIWSAFVNNYLKGQKPKPFDFLYWNADSTNIPAKVHSFYLRNMYLNNLLINPGAIQLNGVPLDLGTIKLPSYFLATHDDHIVPWKSAYQGHLFIKKKTRFVLAGSGHVAGVVNHPSKDKYGYWVNKLRPNHAEHYLASATFHPGSWWQDWSHWLKKYTGKLIALNRGNSPGRTAIEEAPGSYVKRSLAEIAEMEANCAVSPEP